MMKVINLTTKFNIKIVSVVFLVILVITIYNDWLLLQAENKQNLRYLTSITEFLAEKSPPNLFSETYIQATALNQSNQLTIYSLNQKLQPIIDEVCMPYKRIQFGYYSKNCKNVVAIGSKFDESLLIDMSLNKANPIHDVTTTSLIEEEFSSLWHGEKSITYCIPIKENGVIVAQAFASVNQSKVYKILWQRTMDTFLITFVMLLFCVIAFHELCLRLKEDLIKFAKSISSGNSHDIDISFSEFAPILNYISKQTEKMTQLDRLNIVGEMAAGIAHEIRNPLTTVKGLLQFMSRKNEFNKHKENFDLMITEINRANAIITEFLSLSKNKAMNFQKMNLNTILQDIYPLLHANALYYDCKVYLDLSDIPNLLLDKNSIHQFILNMIQNSIDAMPDGGSIHISTVSTSNNVVLTIKDSGIGISKDIQDHLFTPFFTTKDKGTGLGLAICSRIIHRHKATLTFNSQIGEGTTFIVTFPSIDSNNKN